MYKTGLSRDRLLEELFYDDLSGRFFWKTARPGVRPGRIAGYTDSSGYRVVCIDGSLYKAHRLAWLYVNKAWPEKMLDHINGDRSDNRISNLREADYSSNQFNLVRGHSDARVKSLGVTFHQGKYMARIVAKGKTHHLGYFSTEDEAHKAYLKAKERLHIFCNEDYKQVNPAHVIEL